MPITGGVPIIGFLSPTEEVDSYPVTNPKYGLGGLRTIGASAGLSLIPQQRREEGMIVFAELEAKYYHLFGGTGDEHWAELKFDGEDGATGPTGPPVRFTFGQTFPEVEESRLGDYFLGASGSGDYEGGLFIFAPLDEDEGVTGTWWEISGVKGDDGDDGATGVQGFQGITGHQGFQGSTGADGFVGGTGPTGVQGFQGITGHQGFQGFSITGATGVQGFQGITGHQGFQGFSITGPTGVQGFQGHTGFQGFQGTTGPAGSGKYFYGPTAPEDTAEGLTLGSKWFNTEVGGEFTYLSDPGNNPYWVMTNVFSATGPQGPIGGGTGNQGFQGPTGPKGDPGEAAAQGNTGPTGVQGFQGPTGVKGETGDGLFDTSYATGTNVNNSINYNSIGNVTGTGRKFPVLLDDGSLTFDFIRTTDLFNNFTISSFDLTEAAVVLIGTGLFSLNGRTFNVSYTPDIIEVSSASISVNTTNTGYPLSLSDPYTFVSATGTSIDYPTSKNSIVTFTITATASDGSSDTATDTITFRQYNYWGIGSETGITVGNLSSLSNNQLLSNRTKTFTVSPGVGKYIYYGYPESYGDATFKVDGIIGGFQKITISGGETHTNANAYDEKYRIYRSDSANLGNTTVEVT